MQATLRDVCVQDAQLQTAPYSHRGHDLLQRYRAVRQFSEFLCEPLQVEDYVVQTMPDVSPTKWHMAHTTWFFETFVLKESFPGYESFDETFAYLFNSYYNSLGAQFPRLHRGTLTRPTVAEVYAYRRHVDKALEQFLQSFQPPPEATVSQVIELGLHHEQQHQELILTDIKHVLCSHPLNPPYRQSEHTAVQEHQPLQWIPFDAALEWVGVDVENAAAFCYDNEGPRHRCYLEPFALASRPVTNAEFLAFIEDGGYENPLLWLADGWKAVQQEQWTAPLYWEHAGSEWLQRTLHGLVPLALAEPVCHVSYYEADAYARWAGFRLPVEAEWEHAARSVEIAGNFVESQRFHPAPANGRLELQQMFGDVWEWSASPYSAYPGYAPAPGAIGEYNGKFMCNQFVLRGGSCATSQNHIRPTYRNFFPPDARWQFSGLRLARNL